MHCHETELNLKAQKYMPPTTNKDVGNARKVKPGPVVINFFSCSAKCGTVKPVLVATSIKQATCIKQACIQIPKQANALKCTCIKQAPVLSKQILIVPSVLA